MLALAPKKSCDVSPHTSIPDVSIESHRRVVKQGVGKAVIVGDRGSKCGFDRAGT